MKCVQSFFEFSEQIFAMSNGIEHLIIQRFYEAECPQLYLLRLSR